VKRRDTFSFWARPAGVALFIALLALPQVAGIAAQFAHGFRPFRHEPPGRVPFSWDMFAIRIERCVARWDPPLTLEGRQVASSRDLFPPLEWQLTFDTAAAYRRSAWRACRMGASAQTRLDLVCFQPVASRIEESASCSAGSP
jgi:hypothetical protein